MVQDLSDFYLLRLKRVNNITLFFSSPTLPSKFALDVGDLIVFCLFVFTK